MGHGFYGVGPNEHTSWELRFCWLPKRCAISKRHIWLKRAYRGRRVIIGPGEPVFLYWWHDKNEHLIWKLKGN